MSRHSQAGAHALVVLVSLCMLACMTSAQVEDPDCGACITKDIAGLSVWCPNSDPPTKDGGRCLHVSDFCAFPIIKEATECPEIGQNDAPIDEEVVQQRKGRIKNVVVLMMENRSFDHMLGFLKMLNPDINGLNGDESLPLNTSEPNGPRLTVGSTASDRIRGDPGHAVPDCTVQVFGGVSTEQLRAEVPPMDGFIQDYISLGIPARDISDPVNGFLPENLPILSTLAMEYAVFDAWYASVPGPTFPNRLFVHSATSQGTGTNDVDVMSTGYKQDTIFNHLNDAGVSWGMYYANFPSVLMFEQLRTQDFLMNNFKNLDQFKEDASSGNLPSYSFLEPRWWGTTFEDGTAVPASDQHPDHSIAEGERLYKEVYETLRASPQWEETLYIITWDEHGGFYDHDPTPTKGVPHPGDGFDSTDPHFNFDRLGIRVPTVMISPWIRKGAVVHHGQGPTEFSEYDHTSIAATLKDIFNLPTFLTKRDAWASTFTQVYTELDEIRTDTIETLPDIPPVGQDVIHFEHAQDLSHLLNDFVTITEILTSTDISTDDMSQMEVGALLEDLVFQGTTILLAGAGATDPKIALVD